MERKRSVQSLLLTVILVFNMILPSMAAEPDVDPVPTTEAELETDTASGQEAAGEEDFPEDEPAEEENTQEETQAEQVLEDTEDADEEQLAAEAGNEILQETEAGEENISSVMEDDTEDALEEAEIPDERNEAPSGVDSSGTSLWLEEYSYEVSEEGELVLKNYYGDATRVTVPGSAFVEGTFYSRVFLTSQMWSCKVRSLAFEKGVTLPADSSYMFFRQEGYNEDATPGDDMGLYFFDGTNLDTSLVTDMSYMFYRCGSLKSIDVSGFDTSSVTDMSFMFSSCWCVRSLDISSFDTSSVTNMECMFEYCYDLTSLALRGIDTSSVTDMYGMFWNCSSLTNLDLGGLDTSSVTLMNSMFRGCDSLTNLDLSSLDTSSVHSMGGMFWECENLTNLNLSGLDTSSVEYMGGMFDGCRKLTNLDVSGFSTSKVYNMENMFYGCEKLTELDLSGFSFASIESDYGIADFLKYCSCLNTVHAPAGLTYQIDLPNVFTEPSGGSSYTSLPLNLTESITLTLGEHSEWLNDYLFTVSSDAIILNKYVGADPDPAVPGSGTVGNLEFNRVLIQENIWKDTADQIRSLSFESGVEFSRNDYWDTGLFEGLINMDEIDLSRVDTSGMETMQRMFRECRSLTELDLSSFDTSHVDDMESMFYGCSSLKTIDLSSFNTSHVLDFDHMFEGCGSLLELDLRSFVFLYEDEDEYEGNWIWTRKMLSGCRALFKIYAPGGGYVPSIELESVYTGSDGLTYTTLPADKSESITLTRALCSEWLNDYSFTVSSDAIVLLKYVGADPDPVVCGSGTVGNLEFSRVLIQENIWKDTADQIRSLSFESGVEFSGNDYWDTGLFEGLINMDEIDLSRVDTSGMENMQRMFRECRSLTELDLSSFDTSNTWDMDYMFYNCRSLQTIDLNSFDTSRVWKMGYMFYNCSSLESIDLSSFEFSYDGLGIDTWDMFYGCRNLLRIHTPGGGYVPYIELPAVYTGSDGLTYTTMPVDKGESITLTWTAAIDDQIRPVEKDIVIYSGPESVSVRADTQTTFSVSAESMNGETLSYQWQYMGANGTSWHNFAGGTGPSLTKTVKAGWDGWKIRCLVTNETGTTLNSGLAIITLLKEAINISGQPGDVKAAAGSTVEFQITAESAEGSPLSYQWQYQGVSSSNWNNFVGGNASAMTKKVQSSWNGWKVRCVVSDPSGNSKTSETAVITIVQEPVRITAQPISVTTPAKKSVTFTVGAQSSTGAALSYQWQYQGVSSTKWNNFANAAAPSMTKTVQESWNGWKVRCIVTDASGNSKASSAAVITIAADPISITAQPGSVTTPAKKNVTFTVGAQSSTGAALSYQWQYQGVSSTKWNNFANASSSSMTKTVQESWNGWKVRCVVTDASGNRKESGAALITIAANPISITSQPASVTTPANKNVTFTVEAQSSLGEPLSYQWQYQGVSSTKWNNFTNATSPSMTKTAQGSWNGWKVRCVITDGSSNTVTSDTARITVE